MNRITDSLALLEVMAQPQKVLYMTFLSASKRVQHIFRHDIQFSGMLGFVGLGCLLEQGRGRHFCEHTLNQVDFVGAFRMKSVMAQIFHLFYIIKITALISVQLISLFFKC